MSRLLELIRGILQRQGYDCRSDRPQGRFEFSLQTEMGRWQCMATARAGQFQLISRLPFRVPEEGRTGCAEFIARLNQRLPIGRFQFDSVTGFTNFVTGVEAEELEAAPDSIEALLTVHTHLATKYLPALLAFYIPGEGQEYLLARVEGRFIYRKSFETSPRW